MLNRSYEKIAAPALTTEPWPLHVTHAQKKESTPKKVDL
jgi:hypothetical protein